MHDGLRTDDEGPVRQGVTGPSAVAHGLFDALFDALFVAPSALAVRTRAGQIG